MILLIFDNNKRCKKISDYKGSAANICYGKLWIPSTIPLIHIWTFQVVRNATHHPNGIRIGVINTRLDNINKVHVRGPMYGGGYWIATNTIGVSYIYNNPQKC